MLLGLASLLLLFGPGNNLDTSRKGLETVRNLLLSTYVSIDIIHMTRPPRLFCILQSDLKLKLGTCE